ncbi:MULTISPECIES: hypothetical protein [Helcococcus]|uniref:ABC transporter permease n=1 Tax=Helcococcus bovis TaxID=3153252 RepID=A0ABW9F4L4_9FIRM
MKLNRNILILIFIINLSLILGFNYIVSRALYNNKYQMPPNHFEFVATKDNLNIEYEKLNKFNRYGDLIFIAETKDEKLIGLYDPDNKYYAESTKILNPYEYRYFSENDYKNGIDVGVYIGLIDDILYSSNFDISSLDSKYNTEVINYFDYNSAIYEKPIEIVKNLFALDAKDITKIYVIDEDENLKKNKIVNFMNDYNYDLVKTNHFKTIKEAIGLLFNGRRYDVFMISSLLSIILVLILSLALYSKTKYKDIYVSQIHGASRFSYILNLFKSNIVRLIFIIASSTVLPALYLKLIHEYMLNLSIIFIINIFLLLFILFFLSLETIIVFKHVSKLGESNELQ